LAAHFITGNDVGTTKPTAAPIAHIPLTTFSVLPPLLGSDLPDAIQAGPGGEEIFSKLWNLVTSLVPMGAMVRAKAQYPGLYRRFGQLLAEERKARGLTQAEVGRRLGKPPSAIWKYENGELRVDVVELIALGRAVGFDPLELMRRLMGAE